MAKSKAVKAQEKQLRKHIREGPFSRTGIMKFNQGIESAFFSTANKFDYNDEGQYCGIIDGQLARAEHHGQVINSQFGYGVYDIEVRAFPNDAAVDPYDTVPASGKVQINYVEPSPMRFDALRELKALEEFNDKADVITGNHSFSGGTVSPLLIRPLGWTEENEGDQVPDNMIPQKGIKIIRFGYDEQTPRVKFNSSYNTDVNSDGDMTDATESQEYSLMGNSLTDFGILPRYEDHVNALVDGGVRRIEREWAYPMVRKMVAVESVEQDSLFYAHYRDKDSDIDLSAIPFAGHDLDDEWAYEQANSKSAKFKNVRALGGLIKLTIPEWQSRLDVGSNNDYQIEVRLTCKKWVPMA